MAKQSPTLRRKQHAKISAVFGSVERERIPKKWRDYPGVELMVACHLCTSAIGLVLSFAKQEGRIVTQRQVSWGYETQFWKTVEMEDGKVKLSGRPDYAL